ncbi:MAG: ABC transporter permease [Hymenobacteraceae bacterium]|nr:ABC transporter permease [Hymenobacteraceae bacterium]
MLRNNLKIAWRSLSRNRASSFINLAGLTVGIGCVLLLALYVRDELAYDRFFRDADRIYQVNLEGNMAGTAFVAGTTPPPAGAALAEAFPQVEAYTRIAWAKDEVVREASASAAQSPIMEKEVMSADSNFLRVFDFPLLEGNAATCLLNPNDLVITETIARKYFGRSEAVGKVLLFGDERKPFTVSGVLRDLPAQSSFQFSMLKPMAADAGVRNFSWSWVWLQLNTYVKLRATTARDPAAVQALEAQFPALVKLRAADAFRRIGQPFGEFEQKGGKWNLRLQPLLDVHLRSAGIETNLGTVSDIKYVYSFAIVGLFIVLLACVNFMNMATARATGRAKEIGIRKVLGSLRADLIRQFYTEAFLHSFLAAGAALGIVLALLGPFNKLAQKSLSMQAIFTPGVLLTLLGLAIGTGLLAGSYPAFYLTSFKPANVLKGALFSGNGGNRRVRNGLVVFQFAVSTALIFCTLVIFRQLHYTRTKDLGLDRENVVVIPNVYRFQATQETLRRELAALPGVADAAITTGYPAHGSFTDAYVPPPNGREMLAKDVSLSSYMADEHLVPSLKLQIIQGRNFSKEFADSATVIVNETTVRQIGWKHPLGEYLDYPGGNNVRFKVIGVVKDFHEQSLHTPVVPFALFHTSSHTFDIGQSYLVVKVRPHMLAGTLKALEAKWKAFAPAVPFDYNFLDDEFAALYRADQRMGTVFNLFTALAIFVACLGLFGLAAYTAERRTKEIGVRKVLGASVHSIVGLLSRDFLKLVVLAALIALPFASWYMSRWLESFAYRAPISAWVFVASVAAVLLIAQATVIFQALKAALANPVSSLRAE